jgi:hypothetical protein
MIGAFFGWQSLLFVLFFASAQGLLVAAGAAASERIRGRPAGLLLRGVHRPEYWEERDPVSAPTTDELPSGEDPGPTSEASENTRSDDRSRDDAEAEGAASNAEADEEVSFGKTGLPFAPFLMLAAVEYLFLGGLAQGWLMGAR